uniref:Uncharacterized protein n=1 Tax=Geospiza parvula TaxID=87175 RepID=A0A8U8C6L4_GEOPR
MAEPSELSLCVQRSCCGVAHGSGPCGWRDGSGWVQCPGGRALGGEAGRSLCCSLGTSPQSLLLLGDQPSPTLWLIQEVFLFPLPLPEPVRDDPAPVPGAGRGWGALTGGWHRAPCPTPAPDGGHGYPQSRDGGSALQKQDPPPWLSFFSPGTDDFQLYGTDAVLSCQIMGDPQPSILWEKDKNAIEPSGRFHMESKGDLYSLLVSCATPKDSGLYVCRAKNSVGETYAATIVAPAFLIAPSSMRVCRGEDVMFTCRVSGQPCPVLEWEKDGHKLSELFESSHFAVGQKPEDWHFLKLFSARPQDGGVYVCRARSGSQEALAAAVLLVEPQALPDRLPNGCPADGPEALADAGKHAKFRCYVTGKPKPEIIWQKDGEPLAPGRRHLIYEDREGYFILKVLYCKPQDQGLYMCTASNTAGQTLSAVQLQVKGRNTSKECQR